MQRDKDLASWEVFCAVVREGSLSDASERLGIDVSAVSRIIRSLESSLGGVTLFDRSIRPLKLTENGEIAHRHAKRLLEEHALLMTSLERDPDAMRGTIRVGLPPLVLQNFLLPFLIDFHREFPEIFLNVNEYTGAPPVSFDTGRGRLDIICGYGADTAHPNIVQIHYGNGTFIPCASPLYIDQHGFPEHPDELIEHTGVVFESPMRPAIRWLSKGDDTRPLRWAHEIHFDSAASAHSACLLGAGIEAGIPTLHCYKAIEMRQLVPVMPGWQAPMSKLYIYTRPETVRLKRCRVFIERYRAYMRTLYRDCERVLRPYIGDMSISV